MLLWLLQSILEACEADLQSCVDRDPACEKFSQCMLYFKGFQAIQCHRLNHWLWQNNRKVGVHSMLSSGEMMHPACTWLMCAGIPWQCLSSACFEQHWSRHADACLWLWHAVQELAVLLQSRMSEVLHVDIHPAARIGRGILMDHATGVVVGETAVVGDNVSLLHQVTLGGSGTGKGVRHPHVGECAGWHAKQVPCNAPHCWCWIQNLDLLWREWL